MTTFQKEPSLDRRTNSADELCVAELDGVIGGSWFTMLSDVLKAQNETLKSIARNVR
jgi:hypothetical protein